MADYNGIADTVVGTDNDLRPWKPYLDQITEVHIEEGVTAIGNSAFRGMKALKKLIFLPALGIWAITSFAMMKYWKK